MEILWQADGVLEDDEAVVAAQDDVSFAGLYAGRGVELVGGQSLLFGPVPESFLPGVEAYQFVFCGNDQLVLLSAGQYAEYVVGYEGGIVCLVVGQFPALAVIYPQSVSMCTDVGGSFIGLVDAVDAAWVGRQVKWQVFYEKCLPFSKRKEETI